MVRQLLKKYQSNFFTSNTKKYPFHVDGYKNREVALLTQHGKERVLAPILKEFIGCTVSKVEGYDTDLFGTFSRDIPRLDTHVATAREKARKSMQLSGLKLAVASEGAFGTDPYTGMFSTNFEVLIWVDDASDLEIIATYRGKTNLDHLAASSWDEVERFAKKVGFPEHYLIIRPEHENHPNIIKEIASWDALHHAFNTAMKQSKNSHIFIETDMRAHANPTRMENIRQAAYILAQKLASSCPMCHAPGFWEIKRISGLPCDACGTPTYEPLAHVYGCVKCAHTLTQDVPANAAANPARCYHCNP